MSRECSHHSKRAGLVTNVDPSTWPEAIQTAPDFESRSVCGRQECIDDAIRRVAGNTNMTAAFYSDAERRAARA